jgi:hypothetical protein
MKLMPILKSTALGLFLACLAFMFLVRVDEDLAGVTFFVLWPMLSFGLWGIFRRQEILTKAATASSKPKPRSTNGKRLLVTAALAIVLAVILAFAINADVVGMAFIPIWIALYYGWPIVSRRLPFLDLDKAPAPVPKRPLWLRMVRGAGAFLGASVLAIVCLASIVVVPIALCEHRAQKVANSIPIGMTVQEVLDTAKDCGSFRAGSDFPWDRNAEGDNIPAMGLSWRRDGAYVTYDLAAGRDISLTESEAIERLHRKLHDGYRWHFSYTYINVTPMHVSFSVIFGPDGRVAEVTPVHGWD